MLDVHEIRHKDPREVLRERQPRRQVPAGADIATEGTSRTNEKKNVTKKGANGCGKCEGELCEGELCDGE